MRKHSMPFFLDYSHTFRNMWGAMCKAIWRLPLLWRSFGGLPWWRRGQSKWRGKGIQGIQNQKQKKGTMAQVEESSSEGTVQVVQVVKKQQPKKGKGGSGFGGKKTKR